MMRKVEERPVSKSEARSAPASDLVCAAQLFLDAFGGWYPDWIEKEIGKLESALERAFKVRCVQKLRSAACVCLDAYGGNVPDWLTQEAIALETASNAVQGLPTRTWDEDAQYPLSLWRQETEDEDPRRGYPLWLEHKRAVLIA